MLPTFTPSYDSSWGDSIPTFGKPRPSIRIRREPIQGTHFKSRAEAVPSKFESKAEPKLTLKILPTWLISKFASYPWVGDKEVKEDHYRAPVIP